MIFGPSCRPKTTPLALWIFGSSAMVMISINSPILFWVDPSRMRKITVTSNEYRRTECNPYHQRLTIRLSFHRFRAIPKLMTSRFLFFPLFSPICDRFRQLAECLTVPADHGQPRERFGAASDHMPGASSVRGLAACGEQKHTRIEPLAFDSNLMLNPLNRSHHLRSVRLSLLLAISRLAVASGFYGERSFPCHGREGRQGFSETS